jgi:ATP/maltotriose-dependent transcriptional regulator MalT
MSYSKSNPRGTSNFSRLRDSPWMITKDPILTKEERDILILVAVHPSGKHLSNSEIGQRLGITVTRVKTQIHQR